MTTFNDLPNHLQDLIFSKMDKWEHIQSLINSSTEDDINDLSLIQVLVSSKIKELGLKRRFEQAKKHLDFYDTLYTDYKSMKKRDKVLGLDRKMFLETKYGPIFEIKKCGKCLIIGNCRHGWGNATIKRGDEIKRYWIE